VPFAWWPFIGFAVLGAVADALIRRCIRLLLPLPVPPLALIGAKVLAVLLTQTQKRV